MTVEHGLHSQPDQFLEIMAPLPDDITSLPRYKTACKYCGISYLMFREFTVLRQKLETACRALSYHDPKLAAEILTGQSTSFCKTQEDMQSLRSSFFALRQFVQKTFQEILFTAQTCEKAVIFESEACWKNQSCSVQNNAEMIEFQYRNETLLKNAKLELLHMQRHLEDVTVCRDDLATVNLEMAQNAVLVKAREQTLMRQVEVCTEKEVETQEVITQMWSDFRRMEKELNKSSADCVSLMMALSTETAKVTDAMEKEVLNESKTCGLEEKHSEQEVELTRLRQSASESVSQARATMASVQQLILHTQAPLKAQIDRGATLIGLITATTAAMGQLQRSVVSFKETVSSDATINQKDDHANCLRLMAEQKTLMEVELQQSRDRHEIDLGKCGKRLSTLKSDYESLQKKTSTDRTLLVGQVTSLQTELDQEKHCHTLQLASSAEACAELSEMRSNETTRAIAAETLLQERFASLNTLSEKTEQLTRKIDEQKMEMDNLLQVVKCQCEERLFLLRKIGKLSPEVPKGSVEESK